MANQRIVALGGLDGVKQTMFQDDGLVLDQSLFDPEGATLDEKRHDSCETKSTLATLGLHRNSIGDAGPSYWLTPSKTDEINNLANTNVIAKFNLDSKDAGALLPCEAQQLSRTG